MVEPNTELQIHYPTTTHVGYYPPPVFRERNIRVLRVRDLVQNPLTVEEFRTRPCVRRTRYLILAQESGEFRFRQFYLGSSIEFEAPSQLRIGLYYPGDIKPVELISRPFEADPREVRVLLRLLDRCRDRDWGDGKQLRIFADDLRLVS